ncbi:MAG: HDIG domain-containing metalloprotein [Candidatus Eisenbacteria bacterium]
MNRQEAMEVVKSRVTNDRLIKHMIAVEAVMKALALRLGEDDSKWALAGLVHDLDYDETVKDPERHGKLGAAYLRDMGVEDDVTRAVESHAGHVPRETMLDKALFAADPLTGLIVAAALMHPDKKLSGVTPEFVLNRFKEKRFAAGADRDQIRSCEGLGLELDEFVTIGLRAMQSVSEELGL